MQMRNYTTYEYKEVIINDDIDLQYLDTLSCFGWEIDNDKSMDGKYILKRMRRIINRVEIIRLERNLDSCFHDIRRLNFSIDTYSTAISLIIGFIGIMFIIGAVFSFLHKPPLISLMIILAIPGLICCSVTPLLYNRFKTERKKVLDKYIDDKYDEIETICKKALNLIG